MSLTVTAADIRSFNPCECDSSANIEALMGGNASIDVQFAMNINMPTAHKLWLILRPQLIEQATLDTIRQYLLTLTDTTYSKNAILAKCSTLNVYGHVKAFYVESKKDISSLDETIFAYVKSLIS